MGLDRFERRYLGLGGGEGGGLEAGCDGDGVFAVTVVDWIDMSVARSRYTVMEDSLRSTPATQPTTSRSLAG